MSQQTLHDRVVLITGAAGGLGRGLVEAFARQGWRVVAGCRSGPLAVNSPCVRHVAMDVTLRAEVEGVIEEVMKQEKRIDALVNNAGVAEDQPLWQISEENWERVIGVNLRGAMLVSRAVGGEMLRHGRGHIINISSFAARQGTRGQASYAAAKAGLIGLTQSLAREWGMPAGGGQVRVNAVMPGVLATAMTERMAKSAFQELTASHVLGRMNSVAEVAEFVAFLAGMENVSGQVFQLDSRLASWT